MVIEWNLWYKSWRTYSVTKLCSLLLEEICPFFAYRNMMSFPNVPWTQQHWKENLTVLTSTVSVWLIKYAFPFWKVSCLSWYLLMVHRFAVFAFWMLVALLACSILFAVLCLLGFGWLFCFVFVFFNRLIEIAANRFPAYFDSDEKLFCMTRSIHLYRELTCCSVLKRYSFPEFKKKNQKFWLDCLYQCFCISKFCKD